MNPPIVLEVTSPITHKTSSTTKIVQSIWYVRFRRFEFHRYDSWRTIFSSRVLADERFVPAAVFPCCVFSSNHHRRRSLTRLFTCAQFRALRRESLSSRSCVGRDQTAGKREYVPRSGPGPDCGLHTAAPDQQRSQSEQSKRKEGNTKQGQSSHELPDIIREKAKPHDRNNQSTRIVSNLNFTQ